MGGKERLESELIPPMRNMAGLEQNRSALIEKVGDKLEICYGVVE